MAFDWSTIEISTQLQPYQILDSAEFEHRYADCQEQNLAPVRLAIDIAGIDAYTQTWGEKSGIWLILAVTRMIYEILQDYPAPPLPFVAFSFPPAFKVALLPEHEQEVTHRIFTAYNDIYDVLVRVHSQSKTRIWNRLAAIRHFPQLTLEHIDTHNENEDTLVE